MKSSTKESKLFVPVCKDYFSDYCVGDCNWFGTCIDFQEDTEIDTTRTGTGNGSDTGVGETVRAAKATSADGRQTV